MSFRCHGDVTRGASDVNRNVVCVVGKSSAIDGDGGASTGSSSVGRNSGDIWRKIQSVCKDICQLSSASPLIRVTLHGTSSSMLEGGTMQLNPVVFIVDWSITQLLSQMVTAVDESFRNP